MTLSCTTREEGGAGGGVGEVCVEWLRVDKGDSLCTKYSCSDLSNVMTYSDIVVAAQCFIYLYLS